MDVAFDILFLRFSCGNFQTLRGTFPGEAAAAGGSLFTSQPPTQQTASFLHLLMSNLPLCVCSLITLRFEVQTQHSCHRVLIKRPALRSGSLLHRLTLLTTRVPSCPSGCSGRRGFDEATNGVWTGSLTGAVVFLMVYSRDVGPRLQGLTGTLQDLFTSIEA